MVVAKVVEVKSNRRNYIIAAIVGIVVVLALALGLIFGLRKQDYPPPVVASLLASDKCPVYRKQGRDNETVTITGNLNVIVMDGAKTEFTFVLTTNASNEQIQLIVNADRQSELQEAKGMEVTATGMKANCSLLIRNAPSNNDIIVAGKSGSTGSFTSPVSEPSTATSTKEDTSTEFPSLTSASAIGVATSSSSRPSPAPLPPRKVPAIDVVTLSSRPSPAPLPPRKKIALVLFAFSNNPASTRESPSQFRDRLFRGKNGQNGIAPIYEKYSNGIVRFQGAQNPALSADVFGWYTLPGKDTDNCNYFDW